MILSQDKEFHVVRLAIIRSIGADRWTPDKYIMDAFSTILDIQEDVTNEIKNWKECTGIMDSPRTRRQSNG